MVAIQSINNAKKSNLWLWMLLIIAIALSAWTALNDESTSENDLVVQQQTNTQSVPNQRKTLKEIKTTQSPRQNGNTIPWDKLNRQYDIAKVSNLFSAHSWAVVLPKQHIKPPPTPPPVAPPAPFAYMGKMEGGPKGTLIFLLSNNQVYSVSKGEKINTFWQLDGETETSLEMTYLPLNLPQVLYKNKRNASSPANTRTMEMNQ
jgi:hypothetical protein